MTKIDKDIFIVKTNSNIFNQNNVNENAKINQNIEIPLAGEQSDTDMPEFSISKNISAENYPISGSSAKTDAIQTSTTDNTLSAENGEEKIIKELNNISVKNQKMKTDEIKKKADFLTKELSNKQKKIEAKRDILLKNSLSIAKKRMSEFESKIISYDDFVSKYQALHNFQNSNIQKEEADIKKQIEQYLNKSNSGEICATIDNVKYRLKYVKNDNGEFQETYLSKFPDGNEITIKKTDGKITEKIAGNYKFTGEVIKFYSDGRIEYNRHDGKSKFLYLEYKNKNEYKIQQSDGDKTVHGKYASVQDYLVNDYSDGIDSLFEKMNGAKLYSCSVETDGESILKESETTKDNINICHIRKEKIGNCLKNYTIETENTTKKIINAECEEYIYLADGKISEENTEKYKKDELVFSEKKQSLYFSSGNIYAKNLQKFTKEPLSSVIMQYKCFDISNEFPKEIKMYSLDRFIGLSDEERKKNDINEFTIEKKKYELLDDKSDVRVSEEEIATDYSYLPDNFMKKTIKYEYQNEQETTPNKAIITVFMNDKFIQKKIIKNTPAWNGDGTIIIVEGYKQCGDNPDVTSVTYDCRNFQRLIIKGNDGAVLHDKTIDKATWTTKDNLSGTTYEIKTEELDSGDEVILINRIKNGKENTKWINTNLLYSNVEQELIEAFKNNPEKEYSPEVMTPEQKALIAFNNLKIAVSDMPADFLWVLAQECGNFEIAQELIDSRTQAYVISGKGLTIYINPSSLSNDIDDIKNIIAHETGHLLNGIADSMYLQKSDTEQKTKYDGIFKDDIVYERFDNSRAVKKLKEIEDIYNEENSVYQNKLKNAIKYKDDNECTKFIDMLQAQSYGMQYGTSSVIEIVAETYAILITGNAQTMSTMLLFYPKTVKQIIEFLDMMSDDRVAAIKPEKSKSTQKTNSASSKNKKVDY